jgi:tRNA modification GTPase
MLGFVPNPRRAVFSDISGEEGLLLLDRGISIFFEGPKSFTGEDCGEFQIHGGQAVVESILNTLGGFKNFRIAEAGEFSRRSFENGKMDLTAVEGLSDLIAAQTEVQRKQALRQSGGELRVLYESWNRRLVRIRAFVEAGLDFSDQDDVSVADDGKLLADILTIQNEIIDHLDDNNQGEIIRDGYRVALTGPPNAGKSSLLNALAKRNIAIVSSIAGTTRDVIEVSLNISGYKVIVSDTAGIRVSSDEIEKLGMERTVNTALDANLVVWLIPFDQEIKGTPAVLSDVSADQLLVVRSKSDLSNGINDDNHTYVSVISNDGLIDLIDVIEKRIKKLSSLNPDIVSSRRRHRDLLTLALSSLSNMGDSSVADSEIICENLRCAIDALGRIVGRVDIEELYGIIFAEFCIGK